MEQASGHLYQLLSTLDLFSMNNIQNGLFSKSYAVILFINSESLTQAVKSKD